MKNPVGGIGPSGVVHRRLAHHDVVFAVSQRLKIAVARDRLYRVGAEPHVEPHQGRPLLGRQQRLKPLGVGVDEDEPRDIGRR